MIKIYVVFRFSQTAEIHQKLSGDAFFGRHPPPATSWPRLQPTKSPRRPSPDPSTPTSTPTNKRNLLWLGAHGAVYICRNLPMVERVLKILKLKVISPHDSIKCQSWGGGWENRILLFEMVQRMSHLEPSVWTLKKTKSEELAILMRYTPSWEFFTHFGHFFGHFKQKYAIFSDPPKIDTLYYHGVK